MSESRERVHIEDSPKRVQTYFGGKLIADTKRLKLVWEGPYYPTYYFPREDVRMELLTANGHAQHTPSRGDAHYFAIKVGDREAKDAAWHYPESPVEELRNLIRFDWNAMDGWFEEDSPGQEETNRTGDAGRALPHALSRPRSLRSRERSARP
jgi:uncharacterized protein (DUF427 family)